MALTNKNADYGLDKDKKPKPVEYRGILPEFEHTPDPPEKPIKPIVSIKLPKDKE